MHYVGYCGQTSNILIWAKCFPCCLKGFLFSKTCLKGCAQPPQFIGKSIIPCTNKKWTSFYSRKKCTALCLMSFDGFSALFALFTWKVEQFTVKMDHFLASQWLFGFSHQTTFWVFWFTQTNLIVFFIRRPPSLRSLKAASWKKQSDSFFVHQKTQKVVWFENPNSHCSARKWSIFTVHCSTFQVHSANSRKPVKTHCAQSRAFLSLMPTRSFSIFSRKYTISAYNIVMPLAV